MPGIDRCDSAADRRHDYSLSSTSCEPSKEEQAAAADDASREAERAAEAKRNAYFASDEDVGGRCARAACDASVVPTQTNDDPRLRDYLRTRAIDRPLEDDVLGNAIVGAVAGGVGAGVRAAAVEATGGAAGRSVVSHIAEQTGKNLAKSAATTTLKNAAVDAAKEQGIRSGESPAVPRATSDAAPEQDHSSAGEVVGHDRIPFAPGKAPVRIPEAPVVIQG